MIKVCMLTTSYPSGKNPTKGIFIKFLAGALYDNNKIQLKIIKPSDKFSSLTHNEGGIPVSLKNSFSARVLFIPFLCHYFVKTLFAAKDSDIIHAHWAICGIIGVFIKTLFKKPLVFTERGASLNISLKYPFLTLLYKFLLKNCDIITANSIHQYEKIKNFSYENIYFIPNGVNKNIFKERDKQKIKKELNILQKKVVLFVGSLIPRKGVDYLLQAFSKLKTRDLCLYIIGEGKQRKKLQNKVKTISDKVFFIGKQTPETVAKYMSAADCLILPSLSEGRSNVIQEALACKTPVLVSNIPGNNELIKNRFNGLLFHPADSEDLKEKIDLYFTDVNLQVKIKENIRKNGSGLNTWKKCAEKYIKLYENVVSKR